MKVEGPEIRGLIGRAYKQLFVEDSNAKSLKAAISAYRLIGNAACATIGGMASICFAAPRAKRDGISIDNALDATEIAQKIHNELRSMELPEIGTMRRVWRLRSRSTTSAPV